MRLKAIVIVAVLGLCSVPSGAQGLYTGMLPDHYMGTREDMSLEDLKRATEYRGKCRQAEIRLQQKTLLDVHGGFIDYFENLQQLTRNLVFSNLWTDHKRKNIDSIADSYCRHWLLSLDKVTCLSESEAHRMLYEIASLFQLRGQESLSTELMSRAEAIPFSSKPWIGISPDPEFRPSYFLTHVEPPFNPLRAKRICAQRARGLVHP